ncbi:MAG: hemolysin family protein [Paludibacteraceae bacterium]|nr:hemolysin family protein [Paludibacteraceae bacterium]
MNNLIIIFISLLFSAFFSGMEIAFISANKLRFELDKKKKSLPTVFLNFLFKNPQQFISTLLVGNNIALVIYGLQMAVLLKSPLAQVSTNAVFITLAQTIIATIIVLFSGEFLPKTIFRINSNLWLKFFSIPLWLCYIILYPVSKIISSLSVLILKIFGLNDIKTKNRYSLNRTDLDFWVQESIENAEDEEIEHEVKIFQNALDFSSVKLKDCMVPRTEVVAFDKNITIDILKAKFIETGFSKILIYDETIDNIIGYIHSSELFKNAVEWREHIQTIPIVPETMPANKLLQLLTQQKKSMAVVVDEFGGIAGIVTLEDIMEEIFGEIEDEHDSNNLIYKKNNDTEYILSGRLEIDFVNQQFSLDIPEADNYVTIAGYILEYFQDFPKINETIVIDKFYFKILRVTNNKIELVNLQIRT